MARGHDPIAALIVPLCIMSSTTYKVSYNDRDFAPASVEPTKVAARTDTSRRAGRLSTTST